MTHRSPFQFEQRPDGSMGLVGNPTVTLNTIAEQQTAVGRDWPTELGLPTYDEEWDAMARIRSPRLHGRLTFIICDESETRLVGKPRLKPGQIALPAQCRLELAHTGFLIGTVYQYALGIEPLRAVLPSWLNVTLPAELEGDYLLGYATFFDSPLAEKAREGLRRGIFTHVCPVVWTPTGAPPGTGVLVQVSLVPGDYPGCPNARILT